MRDWKNKLYEQYVSTGQSAADLEPSGVFTHLAKHQGLISAVFPGDRSVRILDLGCGHGALLHCLKNAGYTNLTGVDVSGEQVALAHRMELPEVVQGEIQEVLRESADGAFDVICLIDVIEHIEMEELTDLLIDARRVLSESGVLILHAPNAEGVFGARVRYGDLTHVQSFTPNSIRQLLGFCGYSGVNVLEDKPVPTSLIGACRRILWEVLRLFPLLLFASETGVTRAVLTQNLIARAKK